MSNQTTNQEVKTLATITGPMRRQSTNLVLPRPQALSKISEARANGCNGSLRDLTPGSKYIVRLTGEFCGRIETQESEHDSIEEALRRYEEHRNDPRPDGIAVDLDDVTLIEVTPSGNRFRLLLEWF